MKYREKRSNYLYQILNEFKTAGEYQMPVIKSYTDADIKKILPFNYWKTCESPQDYYLCFYIDDYQFERIWNEPLKWLEVFKRFKGLIAPDFSLYRDLPMPINIYNCWRNKVLTAFYQRNGIKVIANVGWSDETSYKWCFDGLPTHSIVAISSNGCLNDKEGRKLFIKGFNEMKRRLEPTKIVVVGSLPKELREEPNIISFGNFSDTFGLKDKTLYLKGET